MTAHSNFPLNRGTRWLAYLSFLLAAAPANAIAGPIAWAVGANGTIVTSTDFGTTWTPQASGTTQDLYGLDFRSPTYGVAVGANGTLVRTTNGGTWTPSASGVSTSLYDVVISGPNTAAAVGADGIATRTMNGGTSWIPFVFASSAPTLRALASTDASTVLAVGDDRRFARSTDGGFTWSAMTINAPAGANPPLNWLGATGIGGISAIAVGADQAGGMVSRYNGSAWSSPFYIGSFAPTPTNTGFQLFDVAYTGSTIVAVGKNGVVTRSTNGGFDWTNPISVTTFDLLDIEFFDALNGLAVGVGGNAIRTTDGGITWSAPIHATDVTLNALAIVDAAVNDVDEPSSMLLVAVGILLLTLRRTPPTSQPSIQPKEVAG